MNILRSIQRLKRSLMTKSEMIIGAIDFTCVATLWTTFTGEPFSVHLYLSCFFSIKREDQIVLFCGCFEEFGIQCSSGWDVLIQRLNRETTCYFGHLMSWFRPHIDTFFVLLLTGNMQAHLFVFLFFILQCCSRSIWSSLEGSKCLEIFLKPTLNLFVQVTVVDNVTSFPLFLNWTSSLCLKSARLTAFNRVYFTASTIGNTFAFFKSKSWERGFRAVTSPAAPLVRLQVTALKPPLSNLAL